MTARLAKQNNKTCKVKPIEQPGFEICNLYSLNIHCVNKANL